MSTPVAQPPRPPASTPSPPTASEEGRPVYTRIATVGLVLIAAAPAFMLALGLLTGMDIGEELPFFATLILVPLIAAGLVWRFGLWAKVVGILAAVGVALMMFWAVFGLAYPGSLGDFVPGVMLPLGIVLAIGGSVAAIVQQRRGRRSPTATPTERRIMSVALGLVALAVVVSVVVGFLQRESFDEADADLTASIEDFAFTEGTYEIAAGEPTTILVRNADAFTHTFTVPDLDIHHTLVPGGEALVEIDAAAGTYTLYCEPHSDMNEPDPEHAGMAGRIIVR
jgi:plastocyanin